MKAPLLDYMREVLEEHTLPLPDKGTVLIEATWLVDMIHKVEEHYKTDAPE